MTAYLLFYFSFGVALAIFIERWINNPDHRIFMLMFSMCIAVAGITHYSYDQNWLEDKIITTLDDFIAHVTHKDPPYDLEQIQEVVPGEHIGDKCLKD